MRRGLGIIKVNDDMKKRIVWSLMGGIVVAIAVVIILLVLGRVDYTLADDLVFEINSEKMAADLFSEVRLGSIENTKIDTSEIGKKNFEVKINNFLGIQNTVKVEYEVIDTVAPVIEGEEVLTIFKNDVSGIIGHYEIQDNSMRDVKTEIEGECDTTIIGSCNLKIIASDEAGNKSSREIVVNIVVDPEVAALYKNEYYVKVNRSQNVVMVYALGRDGEYNNLVKTFVASTGRVDSETPLGVFTVSNRYEALYLVGNVWGHYATRIIGPYYFHSVPYFTRGDPHWGDLEYLEYNKLGEGASAGCVRLAVRDAKWVYDNLQAGTTVEIYDADDLPDGVEKPAAIKIDVEDAGKRGWDPTDSDEASPWR